MFVNNGQYRKSTFVIRRYINGVEKLSGAYPIVERFYLTFADQPSLTLEEMAVLTDVEYLNRLSLFYSYIEFKYPFFQLAGFPALQTTDIPYGTDALQCPLDYTIAESVYANFDLVLSQSGLNKEAVLNLVFQRFNGDSIPAGESLLIEILLKEYEGTGYMDWSTIEGRIVEVQVTGTDTSISILPLFRYMGVDDQTISFKNIYAEIIQVETGLGVEIGMKNIVFTESFVPFYLGNIISNIETSYQDFPGQEALEGLILSGKNSIDGSKTSFLFEFTQNQKTRPVFMYPAIYADLMTIEYVNEGGIDLLDSGAFDLNGSLPKQVIINGTAYKVYAAKNMILYTKKAVYKYNF